MTTTPLYSGVLLRMHGDISDTAFNGVKVQDFHSPHNSMSIEATVLSISPKPLFLGPEMEAMRSGWGEDVREFADLCSMTGDVPIEVKVGDTVMFDYRLALPDAEKAYRISEDELIVNYSALIARVDPDGVLYPLNGLVFVVPKEVYSFDLGDDPGIGTKDWMRVFQATGKMLVAAKETRVEHWMVIAEGCLVKGWLDEILPEEGWPPLKGRIVHCDPRAPYAMEAPLFSKYDHDGKRFHVINRHHILAYSH